MSSSTQNEWQKVNQLIKSCENLFDGQETEHVFNALCNLLGHTLTNSADPAASLGITMLSLSQYLVTNDPRIGSNVLQRKTSEVEREEPDDSKSIN